MRSIAFYRWAVLVATSVLLALVGCDRKVPETPSVSSPVHVTARLKWLPGTTYIGSIIAQQGGYWAKEGLDVKLRPGGFEADPIKLVASGAEQFGITGGDQLLQARANGVPIVAIFAELRDSPVGWMSLKESGITKPQDLIGKKVGSMAGTNVEPMFDALMAKLQIDPSKITKVPVKFDMSPLFSGQVDAIPVYLHGQPVELGIDGKQVTTINPADYGVRLMGNVVFTSETLIRDKPQVVQAYVNGLLKAWQASLAEPDKHIDMMLKVTPELVREKELASFSAMRPFIRGNGPNNIGPMDPKQWQETRDVLVRYAGLPAQVDVAKAFDNRFVESAYNAGK